jgi:hypothetical protein
MSVPVIQESVAIQSAVTREKMFSLTITNKPQRNSILSKSNPNVNSVIYTYGKTPDENVT